MLKRFGGMKFRLMLFSLALVYSSIEKSFRDTLLLANFTKSVIFPFDKEYRRSVVMANYDCKFLCPYIVLRPITVRGNLVTNSLNIFLKCSERVPQWRVTSKFDYKQRLISLERLLKLSRSHKGLMYHYQPVVVGIVIRAKVPKLVELCWIWGH